MAQMFEEFMPGSMGPKGPLALFGGFFKEIRGENTDAYMKELYAPAADAYRGDGSACSSQSEPVDYTGVDLRLQSRSSHAM